MSPAENTEARKRREERTVHGQEHTDVGVLRAELDACRGMIDALRAERDDLRAGLAAVTAQRDEAYDRLDVLRDRVNGLNRQLRAMSRAL